MMGVKVGDRVLCQFYNSVERVFYGDTWVAVIIGKSQEARFDFLVNREGDYPHNPLALHHIEILKKMY